ncbi:MAG: hypothetical protein ACOYOR_08210 [Flavobacterium psychrophilum]
MKNKNTKKTVNIVNETSVSYSTFFDQQQSIMIVRESNVNHGNLNYSEIVANKEKEKKESITTETVNFTF